MDTVLSYLGTKAGVSRRQMVGFMGDDAEKAERKVFKGGGLIRSAGGIDALQELKKEEKWAHDDRILGTGSFVESILQQTEGEAVTNPVCEHERYARLESVINQVCEQSGILKTELTGGSRRIPVVQARRVVCCLGVEKIGLSAAAVGRYLNISKMSASTGVYKGKDLASEYKVVLG